MFSIFTNRSRQSLAIVALAASLALTGLTHAQQPTPSSTPPLALPSTNFPYAPQPTQPCPDPTPPPEEKPKDPFSANLTLNQDSFFGFYPIFSGSYNIDDQWAFTFYGQFWTTPSFSTDGQGGLGLWTEAGVGVSLKVWDGLFVVNPQLAFLSGSLLSGANESRTFEGVVPTLTINHNAKFTQGQAYFGYYLATSAPSNNDFVHWWIYGGVTPFADSNDWLQIFTVGAHVEQLFQTKNKNGPTSNIYTWVGPYIQFSLPNNAYFRFAGGWDTQDRVSGTFYKATMGFSF